MFGNLFWYKPIMHRLVPNVYGNLRPAGAKTVWLLQSMLQMYATQHKTSILNNNYPTKNNTMVEPVAGLVTWLQCFEPPHPREPLRKGLAEGGVSGFY
jgi:hypothetical protein